MVMVKTISCPQYSATFSAKFCAESHQKANTPESISSGWRTKCRRCPIGAANLGTDQYLERSVLYGTSICARCERPAHRLVRRSVCVSCYNRELENATGLNKRGNPLQLIRHYRRALIKFVTRSGETMEVMLEKVLSEDEAIRSIKMTVPDLAQVIGVVLQ